MRLLTLFLLLAAAALAATPDVNATLEGIKERYEGAGEYQLEGELQLVGQRGSAPARLLSQSKVKLAAAPDGRFYLRIEGAGKDAYVLVSNGQKSWAWVPRLKQYTEEEAAFRGDEDADDASDSERDLAETFVRLIMPALSRLRAAAASADFSGEVQVKFGGRKANWPLLRVLSRPAPDQTQTLTQLAIEPETLAIGRMIYSTAVREAGVKTVIQMTADFDAFQVGPVEASTFEFHPPKGVKLVDTLPIPGQTGSALLNQAAPDFELKSLDGDKVRLTDLRGRPVLLSFWASWCPPCRRELPDLTKIYEQNKDKGLVVLGINDEGKGPARKFADQAGLGFPTLDDSGRKAHGLYRVRAIPSLFLIDKEGKIVLFMRGAKEPSKLRAALASAGL